MVMGIIIGWETQMATIINRMALGILMAMGKKVSMEWGTLTNLEVPTTDLHTMMIKIFDVGDKINDI